MWIIFFTLYVQLSCQLPDNEHNHQILNSHTNFDNLDDRYIFLVGQMTLLHEKMDKMIVEIQTLKETLANEQTQTTTPMRLVDKRPMSRPSTVRPPRRTPTPTRARSAAELAVERQQFKSMLMSLEKLPLVVEKLLLTNLTSVSSRVIQHATKFRFKPPLAVVGERRSEQVLDGREIEAISIRGIMHSGTRWLRQSINAHFSKRLRYAGFKFTPRDHSEQVVCDADGLYGWKHGLIDRRQLQQLEENNHVLIVTFLHLWPFLFRQRRQPYLKKTQLKPNAPLSQFMRYKPTTETFDDDFKFPFVPYTYKNYVQMRSAKYRNFLWAMSQSKRVVGVRYEDLISQNGNFMSQFLDSLDRHFGLTASMTDARRQSRHDDNTVLPQLNSFIKHSKSRVKQWTNAVEFYLDDAKRGLAMFQNNSGFGWSTYGLSNLDRELERMLGYIYPTNLL